MAAHTHSTVKPSFWTGKTGRKLRAYPDAQRLAFYLMTCPHRLMTGLYYLPKLYITHELGLDPGAVDAALDVLSSDEIDFAHYDEEAELVFVVNLAEHQVGDTLKGGEKPDKRIAAIRKLIAPHSGHPLHARFVDRYNVPYCLNMESMGGASKGLLQQYEGLRKPLLPIPAPAPVPNPVPDEGPPEPDVGTPVPDDSGKARVTARDAHGVYARISCRTYPLQTYLADFQAVAAQANDDPDPASALEAATAHFLRPGGWALGDGNAVSRPKHLAQHFHRELAEARGQRTRKRGGSAIAPTDVDYDSAETALP